MENLSIAKLHSYKASVFSFIGLLIIISNVSIAQVQVSEEPHHHKVLENKYIRLLDVWIEPGDTTLFHIHSTPSLFTHMVSRKTQVQVNGEAWMPDSTTAGNVRYNPFSDILVHRVCNADKEPFHVLDIELLSAFDADQQIPDVPQAYPLIMDNDKAYAYKMDRTILESLKMVSPGPMIAILVSGGPITFHNELMAVSSEIQDGQYMYIDPGAFLSFTFENGSDPDLILFEIK